MARKKKHEEHENHERWLVSYADFITLLFAFFVVMYSVSSVNEGKYRVLSESMTASFRSQAKSIAPIQVGKPAKAPSPDSFRLTVKPQFVRLSRDIDLKHRTVSSDRILPDSVTNKETLQKHGSVDKGEEAKFVLVDEKSEDDSTGKGDGEGEKSQLGAISAEISEAMKNLVDEGVINIRRHEDWLEIEINTGILFYSGSAIISAEAEDTLIKLSRVLEPQKNAIEIEGHTDNVPIETSQFPSNWELSAARAASVAHALSDYGIEPRRLSATGFGEFRPILDNSTEENRQRNRRVILVVTKLPEGELEEDESDLIAPQDAAESTFADAGLNPEEREKNSIPPLPKQPVAAVATPDPNAIVEVSDEQIINAGPYLPNQHPDDVAARLAEQEAQRLLEAQAQADAEKAAQRENIVFPPTPPADGEAITFQPIQSPFGLGSQLPLKPFPVPDGQQSATQPAIEKVIQ